MKRKGTGQTAILVAVILCISGVFVGCDRKETIAHFNHIENENVEDRATTEENEAVDDNNQNVAGTEQAESVEEELSTTEKTNATENSDLIKKYDGNTVSLMMVGDILLHTPVAESGLQENGSYQFDSIFVNTKEQIQQADLALVNEEVIIGGKELGISGYPCFNAPYELGDALVGAGFDVVLHATNHALDQGKAGIKNCLSFWEKNYPDIAVLGINGSKEAQDSNIYVYEQDGIRIAVLNYTYGTNGIALPADMPYAVNLLTEEKVISDLELAGQQADFIVVCPHWGTEYQLSPSAEQERWTQIFLENGVDLVLGTHPHVIEPIEWVSDENGNEMLVYYSLGNFVNWTSSSGEGIANRMVGGMAQVTVGMENGEAFILEYDVEPLVCHVTEGTGGVTVYRLCDYTDELAGENAIVAQDEAFSKEYCENLCHEVWGK